MSSETQVLVVAGPSGVGKSTLIRAALEDNPRWTFSISATTRAMREHETDGTDYFFMSRHEFSQKVNSGEFLEYANVYGNLYGTLRSEFKRAEREGKHLLIEIDSVGSLSIRSLHPEIPNVAIVPRSYRELRERLVSRGTEDETEISIRGNLAYMELARMREFDFVVVNDHLDTAVRQFKNILEIVESGNARVAATIDDVLSTAQEVTAK